MVLIINNTITQKNKWLEVGRNYSNSIPVRLYQNHDSMEPRDQPKIDILTRALELQWHTFLISQLALMSIPVRHECCNTTTKILFDIPLFIHIYIIIVMTTASLTFPGPLSTKRRRMRSGGATAAATGVAASNGNATNSAAEQVPLEASLPPELAAAQSEASTMNDDENISEQKTTQTSKCKGATTIPIFLKSKFIYF